MDKSHAYGQNMDLYINTYFMTSDSAKYILTPEAYGANNFPPEASRWRQAHAQRQHDICVHLPAPFLH